ncbi:MAG: hypothetical protein OSB10_11230, partial [Planctomycetota bacterium]|nr:hypothetical protein [Planctomycetota bacterium]
RRPLHRRVLLEAELDLAPAWDSLPTAWQDDLNRLVDELEKGANPDLWARSFGLMERLDAFLRGQPELVCSSTRLGTLAGVPADASAESRTAYVERLRCRAAAVLTSVTTSRMADSDNLSLLDLRELAAEFLPDVEDKLNSMEGHEADMLLTRELVASLVGLADELIADTSDQAGYINGTKSVAFDSGTGLQHTVTFVKIDGRWCDASLAAGWQSMMALASEQVSTWTANTQSGESDFAPRLLDALEEGMAALEEATDGAEIDGALDETTGKVGALLMRQKLKAMLKG